MSPALGGTGPHRRGNATPDFVTNHLQGILDAFARCATIRDLANRLPPRGTLVRLGGLPGSSGAVLAAWLARGNGSGRMVVVVATTPADAERWLGDLQQLLGPAAALYPQREGLGEEEPHYEIAGERVETLAALVRGDLRVLVTTARASAERTAVPDALESLRVVLQPGQSRSLGELVAALDRMGYRRVAQVTEVAEFSVRGGIVDLYGFGMANPVRLEWWGDDIASVRAFDLTTQRSGADLADVTVLPIAGAATAVVPAGGPTRRRSLLELVPGDALVIEESPHPNLEEVERAWREADHHREIARRLGEDAPPREELFVDPVAWQAGLQRFARLATRDDTADVQLGFFPPEKVNRDLRALRALLGHGTPTLILCDNEGQRERLDELLEDGGVPPAGTTLAVGALDGGFVMPTPDAVPA